MAGEVTEDRTSTHVAYGAGEAKGTENVSPADLS
jgi:hypothetical protein